MSIVFWTFISSYGVVRMPIQDVLKYLQIIRKWWWVIVLLFAATMGTMLAVAYLSETQYEATVTVLISAPPPQEVPLYSQFGRQALSEEIERTRESFIQILQEGDAAEVALDRLPDVKMRPDALRERITTDFPENSNLLRVHVRASDPDTAARLANTLVEAGMAQYGELLAAPTVKTRMFIENEFNAAEKALREAEAELEQFKINNKIGDLKDVIRAQYDLIKNLQLQSDQARVAGDMTRVQALEQVILEREAELQDLIGLSDEYNQLVSRVAQADATHTFLLDRLTEAQIKENQIRQLASIQVITPARPPKRPVAAINAKIFILGAITSVMTGVLLTFLLEYLTISAAVHDFKEKVSPEMISLPEKLS